jgi:hypothetical protein
MVAISRSKVSLYITAAGVNASTVAVSDKISGEIKSYSKSGGEDDVESVPVFGGFVDKEKPTSQFEIEFEIIPDMTLTDWEKYVYATDSIFTTFYTTASQAPNKAIFIQAQDGSNYKSWAFNNCNGVTLEMSHSADDNQTKTLRFKFSPTTGTGVPNFLYKKAALTTFPVWTSLGTGSS